MKQKKITAVDIWKKFEKGLTFNNKINLDDTVESNENFFIGKQWEGVQANGLPTPVFNFLKRVTLFTVASVTSDNLKIQSVPLAGAIEQNEMQTVSDVVNHEFDRLMERNKVVNLMRVYMRNAAVDSDGCTYTFWDGNAESGMVTANGKKVKGAIKTEIVENNRVYFGNPNDRRVQTQPFIIIMFRRPLGEIKDEAKGNGVKNLDDIKPDTAGEGVTNREFSDDEQCTELLYLYKDKESGTIHGIKSVKDVIIKPDWDLGIKLYPVTWLNWDYVQNSYHGQALITGLIPNQIFINKLFAMSMISMMTTAFPKIVFDKTRVAKWDNRVGAAIGINGGDVASVAKIIDPAQISPQIAQFIELAVNYTQTFLGATPAALGDTRPDNTSAIIALQRAASTPNEITKQNMYESLEELGYIYLEFMANYYGKRMVTMPTPQMEQEILDFAGIGSTIEGEFDFDILKDVALDLKLDIGASSYWSEIASTQTLDNLLMQNKISLADYLERMPDGYISKKQELIDSQRAMQGMMPPEGGGAGGGQLIDTNQPTPIPQGGGYSALQRKVNETGVTA